MNDRAIELAACLMCNPWVAPAIKDTCEALLKKWEGEDVEKAAALEQREDTK